MQTLQLTVPSFLTVTARAVLGAGKGEYYNPSNQKVEYVHGHIASKSMNLDLNAGWPTINFCKLPTLARRIHFIALAVDLEDLKFPVTP